MQQQFSKIRQKLKKELESKVKKNTRPILCSVPLMKMEQVPAGSHITLVKHTQRRRSSSEELPSDVREISSRSKTELM